MLMNFFGPPNHTMNEIANAATQGIIAKLIRWAPDASTHSPHTEWRKGTKLTFLSPTTKVVLYWQQIVTESFRGILSQAKQTHKSAHIKATQLNNFDLEKLDTT